MPNAKKRSLFELLEHPLAALVSMLVAAAMIGGSVVWVYNLFVLKSDFVRLESWHAVDHANIRVERLQDEVDRYANRELVEGKLNRIDDADKKTFEKKLATAQKKLEKAQDEALDNSKVKRGAAAP